MKISLIASVGKNNELGSSGNLIWKIKEDLKFFKDTTTNHPVVMGRKTFESLPKVLPNRENIVISRSEILNNQIKVYKNIKDFLNTYKTYEEEIFIIGGATMYLQFLDLATTLYLTEIDSIYPLADTFFPNFNKEEFNKIILSNNEEAGLKYSHVLYKRK